MSIGFSTPWWLALAALSVIMWAFGPRRRLREDGWARAIDASLLAAMRARAGGQRVDRPRRCIEWLAVAAVAVALSGPALRSDGGANDHLAGLIVVLDLSRSMLASDGAPTRADDARAAALALLEGAQGRTIALVGYAGDAYVLTPPSRDFAAARDALAAVGPDVMPDLGSRLDRALTRAEGLAEGGRLATADVIVIADGADDRAAQTAQALAGRGLRVSAVAVGSLAGAPPRDALSPILRGDPDGLAALAAAGGGWFVAAGASGDDVAALARRTAHSLPDAHAGVAEPGAGGGRDLSHWAALLAAPFALLLFRRRA